MKGLEPFRTWDETYVHRKHNEKGPPRAPGPRRRSARSRGPGCAPTARGGSSTPPTATTRGPGSNPGFHDLIERGIRWASRTREKSSTAGRASPPASTVHIRRVDVEIPNYLPGRQWGTQGEPIRKMQKPSRPGRIDQAHGRCPPASSPSSSPPSPRSPSRSAWPGTTAAGSGSPRRTDYPNTKQPRRPGPRPDQHLRGHRRRRPGRQVQRLRRGAEHPHQPALLQRRRDRPPGPRHAVPEGYRRRRPGRREEGALHRLGNRRHPRRPEQPALGSGQLGLGNRRLLGVPGQRSAARRIRLRPGPLPLQARRLEARIPPQHEQ